MRLKNKVIRELVPTAPFNFDTTFHKPAHFPSGDNFWDFDVRFQTFLWEGINLGIVFRNAGTIAKPKINVEIYSQENLSASYVDRFLDEVRYRYNLDLYLAEFYRQFSSDPLLGPVIKRVRDFDRAIRILYTSI